MRIILRLHNDAKVAVVDISPEKADNLLSEQAFLSTMHALSAVFEDNILVRVYDHHALTNFVMAINKAQQEDPSLSITSGCAVLPDEFELADESYLQTRVKTRTVSREGISFEVPSGLETVTGIFAAIFGGQNSSGSAFSKCIPTGLLQWIKDGKDYEYVQEHLGELRKTISKGETFVNFDEEEERND